MLVFMTVFYLQEETATSTAASINAQVWVQVVRE